MTFEVFQSLIKFTCDKLIDYRGEKPSTAYLLKMRIRKFFAAYLQERNHSIDYKGAKLVRLDRLEMFVLSLVGHLGVLDYFLKYPSLQETLLKLPKNPIRPQSLNQLDKARADCLLYYVKKIQK